MSNSKRWARFVAWLASMPETTRHGVICYDKYGHACVDITASTLLDTSVTIKELKRLAEEWKKGKGE